MHLDRPWPMKVEPQEACAVRSEAEVVHGTWWARPSGPQAPQGSSSVAHGLRWWLY